MSTKVLYVEDEPFLGRIVLETLQQQGFDVRLVVDGALVMQSLRVFIPDIVVLDIMLPNLDGYTLCGEIKGFDPSIPILFLTAKTETADLVKGFEMGGSDYLRKPFSLEELIVRIKNLLRMHSLPQSQSPSEGCITIGKYKFVKTRYELISPTKVIKLSARDMQVVDILAQNINHVVDRKQLLLQVWGDDSFFNSRTLDVYIRKLRDYLSEDSAIELVTLKGKGYLFMVR
jgi:DNA-binding response OmpR family regulator